MFFYFYFLNRLKRRTKMLNSTKIVINFRVNISNDKEIDDEMLTKIFFKIMLIDINVSNRNVNNEFAKKFCNVSFDDMTTIKLCFLKIDLLIFDVDVLNDDSITKSTMLICNLSNKMIILFMISSYFQIKFIALFNFKRFRQTSCFDS